METLLTFDTKTHGAANANENVHTGGEHEPAITTTTTTCAAFNPPSI